MPITHGIHYDVRGAGEPVLFLQGAGVPGAAWQPQIEALANRFHCAWFDNRGVGRSPAGGTLDMAADARAVLDALGWSTAHLVGHSLGGLVARELVDRARSVALLCTFERGTQASRPGLAMAWIGLRTYVGTRRMRRNAFLEIVLGSAAHRTADLDAEAERFSRVFGRDLADPASIAMAQLRACAGYGARFERAVPTLVISGAHDPLARPAFGRALAASIADASFHEIAGAGHGAPITHADEVNRLLAAHVANAR